MKKIKEMPKIRCFIKGTAFIAGLLVIMLLTSLVLQPKNVRKELDINKQAAKRITAEKKDSIDILVVGDSESYSSISPMEIWRDYGYTSYICGAPAQMISDSFNFIELALENQSLKLVVLETNAVYRTLGVQKDIASAVLNGAGFFMPVFEYHNRWKVLSAKDFLTRPKFINCNDLKGFNYRPKINAWSGDNYMCETTECAEIPKVSKAYLEKIKELCDENGIEFLLLSSPSATNWNYKKHNGIQKYADENGIKYLDLNLKTDVLNINWSVDTLDKGDHLNFTGAKKVSSYIGHYIQNNYLIIDHRADENYAYWNDSLVRYEVTVNERKKEDANQKSQ